MMIRIFLILALMIGGESMYAQAIKICTYNIRYSNPGDGEDAWINRKDDFHTFIDSLQPDIFCLQEVLKSQLDDINTKPNVYSVYGVGREDGKERGEYCPVFYKKEKFNLLSDSTFWLSENPEIPGKGWDAACERLATILFLEEKNSHKKFVVINTHWDHMSQTARENSAELILNYISTIQDQNAEVILVGDLNAEPENLSIKNLETALHGTCPDSLLSVPTYNGFYRQGDTLKHIDYIFLSKSIKSYSNFQILTPKTKAGRELSDHFPLVIDVAL
ncbi:MAG: endonuclease/exonuclease/phosphatase family protein [Flavobacteriales bacterium]